MAASDPADDKAVKPDGLATVRLAARRARPWALVLAVVLVVLGILFGGQASWGDVPTWTMAVTTLLAFAAASFAGLVAYELLKVESGRDLRAAQEREQRREAESRGQASKVAAWYGTWLNPVTYSGGGEGGPPAWPGAGAVIRNASDLPVYDVRITYFLANPAFALGWMEGKAYNIPELIPVIPPGEEQEQIPGRILGEKAAEGKEPMWLVAIEFTDADGRRWLRDPHGALAPADWPQLRGQDGTLRPADQPG